MKKFLMALVVLAIASAPALAGPNANGVIVVHNTGIAWTSDLVLPPQSPVPACADIVNQVEMAAEPFASSAALVWKVYAAFPVENFPRLKGCGWGVGHPSVGGGAIVIQGNDAPTPAVFYLTTAGWPGDNTFIGMSFTDSVRVDPVDELFWFGGYAYAGTAGEPQSFCIIPHEGESNRFFLDDAVPQNADPIAGYGCLGFGVEGVTPCPAPIPTDGACCFPDGTCTMVEAADCVTAGGSFVGGDCTPDLCPVIVYGACCLNGVCDFITPGQCAAIGGTYYGNDVPCTPGLCPPVPTESKSWGQIKADYR